MSKLQDPVLVVDDEADIRDLMEMTLMKMGLRVQTAVGVEDAKDKLDNDDYSLVLTDMRMPDGSGLEVVQYINELMLDTPVAVITAFGNADQAVEALKAGAFDYLQKPITLSQLRSLVKSAVSVSDHAEDAAQAPSEKPQPAPVAAAFNKPKAQPPKPAKRDLSGSVSIPESLRSIKERFSSGEIAIRPNEEPPELGGEADMPRLLGMSPQMVEVRHLIRRLARSGVPVYISGESGTGKEQAARTIHELSDRADKPFIAVNCGAIPENLVESEFFGYKKGAFTGANQDQDGLFVAANGGTLFLDEVADLPLSMQVKLLRAIQERAVRPIGGDREEAVDVRIISATHHDLARRVAENKFREDLYYRLNVIGLTMPPLRERDGDIAILAAHLLAKLARDAGYPLAHLSPAALAKLEAYPFPGNVRELENILERALTFVEGDTIEADDIHLSESRIPAEPAARPAAAPPPEPTTATPRLPLRQRAPTADLDEEEITALEQYQPRQKDGPAIPLPNDLENYMQGLERNLLIKALEDCNYNKTKAAEKLGISFRAMRYKLKKLGID